MREIISISEQACLTIKKNFQIEREPLRISFYGGPGDVVGTYYHWKNGEADPRVPSITYSSQMFELAKRLGARLQMISPFAAPEEIDHDVRFVQVERREATGRISTRRSQHKYISDVSKKIDEFDPHLVIVSSDFPNSGWKKIQKNRKLIISVHNTFWPMGLEFRGLKGGAKLKLLEHRSRYFDGAICTSQECVRQIEKISKGRVTSLAEHPQVANSYKVQHKTAAKSLLYLGRIEKSKGIFMLLDAFANLKRRLPELSLVFAGSGSDDDALHEAIANSKADDVRFLGQLNSREVHKAISRADLLVCPTTSGFNEGLALVGFEAAAHGVPSVLSSVVPALELLRESSVIFKADSTEDLSRQLEKIISDTDAYSTIAENTAQVRSRLYDPTVSWGSQLAKIIQDL